MSKANWDDLDSRADESVQSLQHHHEEGPEAEVVDAVPAKKKSGPNPKLIAALLGLVVLGVVAFFAMQIMEKMGRKAPAKPPVSQVQPVDLSAGAGVATKGTVLMDDKPAASAPAVTPQIEAAATTPSVQPPVTAPAQLPAVAPAVAPVVAQAPAVAATPMVDERAHEQINALDSRMDRIESALQTLTSQKAAAPRKAQPAVDQSAEPRVRVAAAPASAQKAKPKSKKSAEVITEAKEPETPAEILRLQLKGVYPPSGADMQAWVMDGDKTVILSKGDVIHGATVLRVEPSRVVTSRGPIN